MAFDTMPPRQRPTRQVAVPQDREERRNRRPSRALIVALVLASATMMVVDKAGGEGSPLQPVRRAVGEVVGPAEAVTNTLLGPFAALPAVVRTNASLRAENTALRADVRNLQRQLRTTGYDERRLVELDGLEAMSGDLGYSLLPAHVIGQGAAQAFADTITIDAGSADGLYPDMTVVNGAGLVGRITAVTSRTATVLLVIDADSTVAGRISDNFEMGLLDGTGGLADDAPLDFQLTDHTVLPKPGQTVVTRGSEGGAPYVAGVPIGEISKVFEDIRAGTYRAVVEPFVDFTALDLVGVVVPGGSGDKVINGSGS